MKIDIKTEDGISLTARMLEATSPKAIVVINPSTATKTEYYLPFAKYLCENQFNVVIWNYRGFCDSKATPLANTNYSYSDIGRFDIPAVIKKIKMLYPDLPLYCIGHSAGGQQIGFTNCHKAIDAMIAVAVSSGYFGNMQLLYRLKALFFFKIFTPITAKLFNYIPAKKISPMESLPVRFTKEWGQWCNEKEWFFSGKVAGNTAPSDFFVNYNTPTVVITADDDEICSEPNIRNFWKNIETNASLQFVRYKAAKFDSKAIGHLGYFRRRNSFIWNDILNLILTFHDSISTEKQGKEL